MTGRESHEHPADVSEHIRSGAKGTGINFAGNLLDYGVSMVVSLVVARSLGSEDYGLYILGMSVVEVVSLVVGLGLAPALFYYLPLYHEQQDRARLLGTVRFVLQIVLITSAIGTILIFLLADPLATLSDKPAVAPVLRVLGLSLPFMALSRQMVTITLAYNRVQEKFIARHVVLSGIRISVLLLLLALGLGLLSILIANVIAWGACAAVLAYYVRRFTPKARDGLRPTVDHRKLLSFSSQAYLAAIVRQFSGRVETYVLALVGTAASLGEFGAATKVSMVGQMFANAIVLTSQPIISGLYHKQQLDRLRNYYKTSSKWLFSLNLPVTMTMLFFAPQIIALFGDDFRGGEVSLGLSILALGQLGHASTGIGGAIVQMTGRVRWTFYNVVLYLIVSIILDLSLIPEGAFLNPGSSVLGAALAAMLSMIILNIARMAQAFAIIKVWPYDWSYLKPVLAAVIGSAVALLLLTLFGTGVPANPLLGGALLLFQMAIMWGVYFIAVWKLGLSEDDQLVVERVIARFATLRNAFRRGPASG